MSSNINQTNQSGQKKKKKAAAKLPKTVAKKTSKAVSKKKLKQASKIASNKKIDSSLKASPLFSASKKIKSKSKASGPAKTKKSAAGSAAKKKLAKAKTSSAKKASEIPTAEYQNAASAIRSIPRNELPDALLSILDEHRYVVRLLKILVAEADELGGVKRPDLESILSILHYIQQQTDRFHHPKEDLIFARVVSVVGQLNETVYRLESEHKQMNALRDEIFALATQLEKKSSKRKINQLAKDIKYYSQLLLEHMLKEEREVFTFAYSNLSAADWRQIDRKIAPVIDPIFGPIKSSRYAELFERYVGHTISVSKGFVPVGLFENTASRIEKFYSKGKSCAQRFGFFKSDAENLDNTAQQFGSLTITSDNDAEQLKSTNQKYESSAKISWQASATNLFLRATLKPYLSRVSLEGVGKLVSSPVKAFKVPPNIRSTKVASNQIDATWVLANEQIKNKRTLLYLPGGGFIFPASSFHYRLVKYMARRLDARGMLVNYRLAPDHPFPAGLEDAVYAYRHLLEVEGVDASEIIIAGDSAGGGLSLSLLLSIREMGLPMPACACVFSPFTDMSFSSPSMRYNRWLDPMLPSGEHMNSYDFYLGDVAADDPLVSPVHASFDELPPILAQVSSTETLLDDTLRVAKSARSQGAKFEVEVWQGLPHVFQIMSFLPESGAALRHAVEFIQKHLPATTTDTTDTTTTNKRVA